MDNCQLNILLVDDDEDDYVMTRNLLSEIERDRFNLEWVSTYDAGLEAIGRKNHDIYLLDYRLGDSNGLELLREAIGKGCKAPMILLTGQGDREVDVEAMKAGAADYLVKGQIDSPLLERSIRYAIKRKQAEEALRKSEEQLRQAQKIEAIGRLAGGMAHDFNNILTIISGHSEIAAMGLHLASPFRRDIEEIRKATKRATTLTRKLLAFSRRQVMDPQILDLNKLILNLDRMLHLIGENIELITLPGEDLGKVRVDPGQIEQVIMNIAVNARDAMPGGGKLTIETANVTLDEAYARRHTCVLPGDYVMLTVSDTGCGMNEEVREHIFEPFFTTKEVGKGTGLGLSMVYGIVKQSGGNIWCYSEEGVGTTFKIYLPRVEEEAEVLPRHHESGSLQRGMETVLVVEDEPPVLVLAARVLRAQGYKVLEAANGDEALRVAQEHPEEQINLLLTDVVMPQMGGKELADKLRAMCPDIKVLFISGYTDKAIIRHGVMEPGVSFLQKPFSPAVLVSNVRELLDK